MSVTGHRALPSPLVLEARFHFHAPTVQTAATARWALRGLGFTVDAVHAGKRVTVVWTPRDRKTRRECCAAIAALWDAAKAAPPTTSLPAVG